MPKVKVKRKSTAIDMTPMSDVMVLLLTFLTTTFIQKEPVQVVTPASVSDIKIPETNVLQILVDKSGKIFLSLDKQEDRMAVLQKVGEAYGVTFTNEQIQKFKLINSFGVPIAQMPAFLDLPTEQQDATLRNYGVPIDSTDNQFKVWVQEARKQNGKGLIIAIKADASTPYPIIRQVMSSLQDLRENRYNLITSLKTIKTDELE